MPRTKNILSYRSSGSVLSIYSKDSVLSVGSIGSVLSVASVGSILSVLSCGSFGSVVSVASLGSILSIGAVAAAVTAGSYVMAGAIVDTALLGIVTIRVTHRLLGEARRRALPANGAPVTDQGAAREVQTRGRQLPIATPACN